MATILLDKSAFQDLTLAELRSSWGKDQILATDVLLLELLGDLRYEDRRTVAFSGKLMAADYAVNIPYRLLCGNELMGQPVGMEGRPVLQGIETRDAAGALGAYIPPSEGDLALLRWSEGEFDEEDLEYARNWIEAVKNFDLEFFERGMRLGLPREQQPISIGAVAAMMDAVLNTHDSTSGILEAMLIYLMLPEDWGEKIRRRWAGTRLSLAEGAPYTAFCARTLFVFFAAVGMRVIGTRRSNFVDAQYLLYLPFCGLFSSGDRVHSTLFPFVSLPGQVILSSSELKRRFAG